MNDPSVGGGGDTDAVVFAETSGSAFTPIRSFRAAAMEGDPNLMLTSDKASNGTLSVPSTPGRLLELDDIMDIPCGHACSHCGATEHICATCHRACHSDSQFPLGEQKMVDPKVDPKDCHADPCHADPCHADPCHADPKDCRADPCHADPKDCSADPKDCRVDDARMNRPVEPLLPTLAQPRPISGFGLPWWSLSAEHRTALRLSFFHRAAAADAAAILARAAPPPTARAPTPSIGSRPFRDNITLTNNAVAAEAATQNWRWWEILLSTGAAVVGVYVLWQSFRRR